MRSTIPRILLVEDNPGDIDLVKKALNHESNEIRISTISDGEEAINHFESLAADPAAELPSLIILDLNLPKRDGREVLERLKTDRSLMHIPVIVFTSSQAKRDILTTYQKSANAYIVKPMDLDQFLNIGKVIRDFWLNMCQLPSARDPHFG